MAAVAVDAAVQATCGCVGKAGTLAAVVSKGASASAIIAAVVAAVAGVALDAAAVSVQRRAGALAAVVSKGISASAVIPAAAAVAAVGAVTPSVIRPVAAMPAKPGNVCRWRKEARWTSKWARVNQLSLADIAEAR